MDAGCFYYIDEQYYIDFPDPYLMQNKETVNGKPHGRPCFYAFKDRQSGLIWMIPISHEVSKYRAVYNRKMQRAGRCDTIAFGNVLGHEKAFLIQNMCPITPNYIKNMYIDQLTNLPVRITGSFEAELTAKAKRVLALQRQGNKLIFPDVLTIEQGLSKKQGDDYV